MHPYVLQTLSCSYNLLMYSNNKWIYVSKSYEQLLVSSHLVYKEKYASLVGVC